ncbi:carbohydrate kinase [candidate division KSB1 bacterium]|nr:carbohydrate kinase [candidate division KSB1 bacterium]
MKTVVGLGEVLWDFYPEAKMLGGAPANVALHCQCMGAHGVIASAVGHDPTGQEIIETLKARGIETSAIQIHPTKSTGTVHVTLDDAGNPSFDCSMDTAFDHVTWNDSIDQLVQHSDAVVTGTLAQRNPESREVIQHFLDTTPALRVFDVNFRGWNESVESIVKETLPKTDILKLNEDEMQLMQESLRPNQVNVKEFLADLVQTYNLKWVALSLGENGCYLTNGSEEVMALGLAVQPVDTIGCGDALVAAMILRYLEGDTIHDALRWMNLAGGYVATQMGATPIYTLQDLEEFESTHSEF